MGVNVIPSIWFRPYTIQDILTSEHSSHFAGHLGLEFCDLGSDYLTARFRLAIHSQQPFGASQGKASVAFAEVLGCAAANLVVDPSKFLCVGQSINANHLRELPALEDLVLGTAQPEFISDIRHMWNVEMRTQDKKVFCVSTLTVSVISRPDSRFDLTRASDQ